VAQHHRLQPTNSRHPLTTPPNRHYRSTQESWADQQPPPAHTTTDPVEPPSSHINQVVPRIQAKAIRSRVPP
jgi:hypothetical protein